MLKRLLLLPLLCTFWVNAKDAQGLHFSLATTQIPPYVYIDSDKVVKGLLVDKLRAAQQTSSIEIDILVMPWARAISEVKSNRIDAIMPTLWSEERETFLVYPERALHTFDSSVIIKRIDDEYEFAGLANIGLDKTIGKTRLVMIHKEFDELVAQGELSIFETTELEQALLMLTQEKLDLVASDGNIANTTISKLGLEDKFTLYPLHEDTPPSYLAFSKKFAEKHDIDAIMEKLFTSRTPSKTDND